MLVAPADEATQLLCNLLIRLLGRLAMGFGHCDHPDILWQNTVTGERYVWFMNPLGHIADASLGIVDASCLLPFLFGARQRRQQHRGQQGNDGNDDQQIYEGKGAPGWSWLAGGIRLAKHRHGTQIILVNAAGCYHIQVIEAK